MTHKNRWNDCHRTQPKPTLHPTPPTETNQSNHPATQLPLPVQPTHSRKGVDKGWNWGQPLPNLNFWEQISIKHNVSLHQNAKNKLNNLVPLLHKARYALVLTHSHASQLFCPPLWNPINHALVIKCVNNTWKALLTVFFPLRYLTDFCGLALRLGIFPVLGTAKGGERLSVSWVLAK